MNKNLHNKSSNYLSCLHAYTILCFCVSEMVLYKIPVFFKLFKEDAEMEKILQKIKNHKQKYGWFLNENGK